MVDSLKSPKPIKLVNTQVIVYSPSERYQKEQRTSGGVTPTAFLASAF